MPEFSTTVPHDLSVAEVKSKLDSFVGDLKKRYPDQVSDADGAWSGDDLRFEFTSFGIKIGGTVTVSEQDLQVNGQIPFAAVIYKGKIVSSITEGLRRALN